MEARSVQNQPGLPCIKRLLQIGEQDSGGSRRVASVLLSLWSGDAFRCDLQSLLYLDGNLLHQILVLISYLHQHGLQLDCLVSREEMNPILEMWEDHLQ
jgi:hypothetical protein